MSKEKLFESELVRLIKRGEQSAFEILFRLHYNTLIHFAHTYVKRSDIADEIVQETFIKVWEIRSTIDETRSIKAFLYRCVHNTCLNFIRDQKKIVYLSPEFISELEGRFQLIDENASNNYFEYLASEQLSTLVHDSIMKLPDQCREVFLLCRFHDKSYQEIATQLNISVNTVKTQLSRAMAKLNEAVKSAVKNF